MFAFGFLHLVWSSLGPSMLLHCSFTYLSFCFQVEPCSGSSICFGKGPSWSAPSLFSRSCLSTLVITLQLRCSPYTLTPTPGPLHMLLPCKSVPVSPAQSYSFIRAQMPFFQGQTALIPDTITPATDPVTQPWSLNNAICDYLFDVCLHLFGVSPWEQGQDSLVGDCVSCPLHRLGRE